MDFRALSIMAAHSGLAGVCRLAFFAAFFARRGGKAGAIFCRLGKMRYICIGLLKQ